MLHSKGSSTFLKSGHLPSKHGVQIADTDVGNGKPTLKVG